MAKVTNIDPIEIGYDHERTIVGLRTPKARFAWKRGDMPEVIAWLRRHSRGPAEKSPSGFVFSMDGKVVLTDEPDTVTDGQLVRGAKRIMPRREAGRLAEGFAETLAQMEAADKS